jgi:hypothetical protein
MSRHDHRLDRTIREPQWTIRIITILILLAGAAVVLYMFTRADSQRERALRGLMVGDTVTRVVERLGDPPYVCPTGSLAHLQGRFPPGWPAAAQANAIERLEEHTSERWIYPVTEEHVNPCPAPQRATEIGIGHDGRVLWLIPLAGRQPLQIPDTLAPGTVLNDTL